MTPLFGTPNNLNEMFFDDSKLFLRLPKPKKWKSIEIECLDILTWDIISEGVAED